jgi:hypothetical protein
MSDIVEPRWIPVDQTKFGYPEGNCFAACVATILRMSIKEMPTVIVTKDFDKVWSEWLADRGLGIADIEAGGGAYLPGLCIASGDSPRGGLTLASRPVQHAVVCHDMQLIHDPHPSREFLSGRPKLFTVFYELYPARER